MIICLAKHPLLLTQPFYIQLCRKLARSHTWPPCDGHMFPCVTVTRLHIWSPCDSRICKWLPCGIYVFAHVAAMWRSLRVTCLHEFHETITCLWMTPMWQSHVCTWLPRDGYMFAHMNVMWWSLKFMYFYMTPVWPSHVGTYYSHVVVAQLRCGSHICTSDSHVTVTDLPLSCVCVCSQPEVCLIANDHLSKISHGAHELTLSLASSVRWSNSYRPCQPIGTKNQEKGSLLYRSPLSSWPLCDTNWIDPSQKVY